MSTQNPPLDLFEQLMVIAQAAFADKQFNVAYHVLAAAYHCAVDSSNEQQLSVIEKTAREQLRWIDANAPGYAHSTPSALKRNHTSIFQILSQQAAIKLRYMSMEHTLHNQEEIQQAKKSGPD